MRRASGTLLLTLVLMSSSEASNNSMDALLIPELQKVLVDFAQRHSLTDEQLQTLLGTAVLGETKLRKGGAGVIDKDVFVLLNEPRNGLVVSGRQWFGEPVQHAELVVIDGQKIRSVSPVEPSNLKIVLFTPSEVKYTDLVRNTGGRYARAR